MILQDAQYNKKERELSISYSDAKRLTEELKYLTDEVDDHKFSQGTSLYNLRESRKPILTLLIYPDRSDERKRINDILEGTCMGGSRINSDTDNSALPESDQPECRNEESGIRPRGFVDKVIRFVFSRSGS